MMKKNNKTLYFIILSFFLFLCPLKVLAGSATTGFNGSNSVYVGNTIDVTLYVGSVNDTNGGLAAFGGNLSYSTDKLELIGTTSLAPFNVELAGSKFGGFGANTINGSSNIMKLTFKAKAVGSTTISYSGSSQPDASAASVSISGCSKTINITEPPSSNNYLSSLTVNQEKLNFNKNTTIYNIEVGADVTSINISASAEDSGASVTGTGAKSLNYGKNTFSIVVTAPSGDKLTYQVNVNRKDNRSSNNKLSSLTVNNGTLSPGFSSKTENYTLSVPFSVSSLNVKAIAEDDKAKVTVSNQNNLIAEETTNVIIKVTAENGSAKVYTIAVTRGKDPNKVLSTNNYLADLQVSSGQLSPIFNKEQQKYIVYVPYEIDTIDITATQEDTKYATVSKDGPEKLSVGNNQYKFTVTAEDSSIREYIVIVYRGENLLDKDISSNSYLKSLKIKNGKLKIDFNKSINIYKYSGKNIDIEAIPEDENSNVNIIEKDRIYNIIVESPSGDTNIYTLVPKENNIPLIIGSAITGSTLASGGIFGYKLIKVKTKKRIPKIKKEKK